MDGARLELVSDTRAWGWRVVNHKKYREKARLQAQNSAQVASGRNAEKVRKYKESQRDTRRHPQTPADTLSNANANTNIREEGARGSRRCPKEFSPDLAYAKTLLPDIDAEAEAGRFKDYEFKVPRKDWGAAWRNWIRTCKDTSRYAKKDAIKWT